jgi:hypothetical protein
MLFTHQFNYFFADSAGEELGGFHAPYLGLGFAPA